MRTSTSLTDPIRVDFIAREELPGQGRLGLTLAPGKRGYSSVRSVFHDRDLSADLSRLRDIYRCDTLVSLMESFEYQDAQIPNLFEEVEALGIGVLALPIRDVNVPRPDQADAFTELVAQINQRLSAGATVIVHCLGGVGRSGVVASAVLVSHGHAPDRAIAAVRAARPGAVETTEQEQYVFDFAAGIAGAEHA